MEKNEVLAKLQDIFRDVFDNEDIVITVDTVAEDIDEWDSLAHVLLVKELEKKFGVKLTSKEILSWDCIGEMIDLINNKIH